MLAFTILSLALVATGCATTGRPSAAGPSESVAATRAAPSSRAATPSPPRPTPIVTSDLPESGNVVFPGTYVTRFEPALTLTIDRQVQIDCAPGYRCRGDVDVNTPNWLDIEFGHDHPMDISINRIDKVFDSKHPAKLLDPPADLVGWISGLPRVKVLERKPIVVGGIDATQIDLQAADEGVVLGPTGIADPAGFGFGPFQVRRIDVLRVGGRAIVVMIGPVNDSDNTLSRLAAATDILQPIVESITWR